MEIIKSIKTNHGVYLQNGNFAYDRFFRYFLYGVQCTSGKLTLASRELILWGGLGLRGSRGASNFPSEIFRKAINFWWNF